MARRKQLPRKHTPDALPDPRSLLFIADERMAIREFKTLWRQIRGTPELAARFQLEPLRRPGRPPGPGSKFTDKAVFLSFFLDLFKLPRAKALRELGFDAQSGSDGFKKLDRYLRAGRPELDRAFLEQPELREMFVAAQQAVAEVHPMVKRSLIIKVKAIVFGRPVRTRTD